MVDLASENLNTGARGAGLAGVLAKLGSAVDAGEELIERVASSRLSFATTIFMPLHRFTLNRELMHSLGRGPIRRARDWLFCLARPSFWMANVAVLTLLFSLADTRGDDTGIFVVRIDGTEERPVAQVPGYSHHDSPRWSHDGKRLAFSVSQAGDLASKMIYVVNADGSELTKVGEGDLPDWSPDDKQLVSWHHGGTDRFGVWVHNVDGSGREWLAEGGSARWSRDGSQLAFAWQHILRLIDSVSDEQSILFDGQFKENLVSFDWSPNDQQIAFVNRWPAENTRKLFLVNTHEAMPKAQVVPIPGGKLGSHLSWSPDGKQLAIALNGFIHLVNLDQPSKPQRLPGQTIASYDPSFSPDGKWIAFTRRPD
jgi:Tol biopolymer transport system component